jgi:hypothetical protein
MRNFFCCLFLLLNMASGLAAARPAADTQAGNGIVVSADHITYSAKAGDTLMSIAQQWTAKSDNWVQLAKVNHINQDANIPIGTGIVIPADLLSDEPSEAQVVALSGNVTARTPDGQVIEMKVGVKLAEGAQIETGVDGFLTMSLPDASRISLPSNSRVKFSKLRMARFTKSPRTELMLLHGHVESRVSPLEASKGSYEVHTPTSVAGVRGTQFRVGVEGDTVTNEVLSGKVAVGNNRQPDALTLQGGTGNVITSKSVGPAIDLLPAPELDRVGTEGAPQIHLQPVTGARSYHVQIANDPDALNVLAESHSHDTHLKFSAVPAGSYYARISAIDRNGLEGQPRIQAVSFHPNTALHPNNAPFVDAYDDKQVTLRWHGDIGQEYMVQVSRDAQFSWLIFNNNTKNQEVQLPRPPFGTYYARVQIINPDGSSGAVSAVQAFIVTDHWVINDGGPGKSQREATGDNRS